MLAYHLVGESPTMVDLHRLKIERFNCHTSIKLSFSLSGYLKFKLVLQCYLLVSYPDLPLRGLNGTRLATCWSRTQTFLLEG